MKYIIIVPDGMFDHPIEELGGKTPLEAAHTPNMQYMAKNGRTGMVDIIPEKMYPGSDIGNMSILGYDPRRYHTGRSPLEAANQNIILKDNEIAFRCNLVTIADGKMADYSAGHIQTKEASILINELNKSIGMDEVRFYPGVSYRHILVLKVNNPKDYLAIKTVPPHDILGKDIKSYLPKGGPCDVLQKLMDHAQKLFSNHSVNQVRVDLKENPANAIWLWGQGTKPNLPAFKDLYGVDGSIISAVDLVNGIGRVAGLEIINVPGATGYYDTNYLGKAQYAINSLKTKDFVYVHIESPDEAGHNGDVKNKITAIERIDRDVVGPILNAFDKSKGVRILLLPDHPTPCALRTHTHEPVGYILYGEGITPDGSTAYNEPVTQAKGIAFKSGEDLMKFFMSKQ